MIQQAPGCRVALRADVPMELINLQIIIRAQVNGQPMRLQVDTGSDNAATLSVEAVRRLGLTPVPVPGEFVFGFGAVVPKQTVTLNTLAVGQAELLKAKVDTSASPKPGLDGTLDRGFLSRYDIDIDPAAGRFRLYSVQGCPDTIIPFEDPYAAVNIQRGPFARPLIPVKIEGHSLLGLIDTGIPVSSISKAAALRIGVPLAALSFDRILEVNDFSGKVLSIGVHSFRDIEIGEHYFKALDVPVIRTALPFDFWVGMNFLVNQRVWLSFATSQIFLGRQPVVRR